MNSINTLSSVYSVTGQISADEVGRLAKQGFKSIITLRPDLEGGETQPSSSQIALACAQHHITHHYVPVPMGNVTADNIASFEAAIAQCPQPILAYCKSGGRATKLFNLSSLNPQTAANAPSEGLCAWLKSKCLIMRLYRAISKNN